jgi:hypothetical protein
MHPVPFAQVPGALAGQEIIKTFKENGKSEGEYNCPRLLK